MDLGELSVVLKDGGRLGLQLVGGKQFRDNACKVVYAIIKNRIQEPAKCFKLHSVSSDAEIHRAVAESQGHFCYDKWTAD